MVPTSRYLEALALIRSDEQWLSWGWRLLIALGVVQLLAGVLFFFAYNWVSIPPMGKLGIVQGAVVLAVGGAFWLGAQGVVGRWLLIAATLLVGVLLAVFGQIYQTGADPFELFTAWAVLTLPWVVVARWALHWLLWLTLLITAWLLWGWQVAVPAEWLSDHAVIPLAAVIPLIFLVVSEIGAARFPWLKPAWSRRLALGAVLVFAYLPLADWVSQDWSGSTGPITLVATLLGIWIGAHFYGRHRPDLPALALIAFAAATTAATLLIALMLELDLDGSAEFLLFAAVITSAFAAALAFWFQAWRRLHGGEKRAPRAADEPQEPDEEISP